MPLSAVSDRGAWRILACRRQMRSALSVGNGLTASIAHPPLCRTNAGEGRGGGGGLRRRRSSEAIEKSSPVRDAPPDVIRNAAAGRDIGASITVGSNGHCGLAANNLGGIPGRQIGLVTVSTPRVLRAPPILGQALVVCRYIAGDNWEITRKGYFPNSRRSCSKALRSAPRGSSRRGRSTLFVTSLALLILDIATLREINFSLPCARSAAHQKSGTKIAAGRVRPSREHRLPC